MAIRSWFWTGLTQPRWDFNKDCNVSAPEATLLKKFPQDYHLFIVTIHQRAYFEEWIRQHNLEVYYKQDKPAFSYRYPNDPAKLLTYILKVKQ